MKKTTRFSLTLLLVFVFVDAAFGAPDRVIDIDGHPVTTQSTYYILPVIRGNGGGLSLGQRNATFSCPLYVTQENQEVDRGLPARFHPVNPKKTTIRVSTDMNVEFDASTVCVQSTVWEFGGVEGSDEGQRRFVKSGGVLGNPGIKTLSNWFKIEKDEDSKEENYYKLVFCPNVCNFCKVVCGELGVLREDGRRFLGLAPQLKPLRVFFKKVEE